MSYAVISDYSQEYFESTIGRKTRKFSLGRIKKVLEIESAARLTPHMLLKQMEQVLQLNISSIQ